MLSKILKREWEMFLNFIKSRNDMKDIESSSSIYRQRPRNRILQVYVRSLSAVSVIGTVKHVVTGKDTKQIDAEMLLVIQFEIKGRLC